MENIRTFIKRSKESMNMYLTWTPAPRSPTSDEDVSRVFTPTLRKVSALVPGDKNNSMLELNLLPATPLSRTPYRHVRVKKSFEKKYSYRRNAKTGSSSPRLKRTVISVTPQRITSPRKPPSSPRGKHSRRIQGLINICDLASVKSQQRTKSEVRRIRVSP